MEPRHSEAATMRRSHAPSPEEILDSLVLATPEKRRLLLQMFQHEMSLLVADDEGMQGARPTRIDRIRRALSALPV